MEQLALDYFFFECERKQTSDHFLERKVDLSTACDKTQYSGTKKRSHFVDK